jgi:hypothetical protein
MTGKTSLRCYACGKPLGNAFWLVSMREDVDRVFTMDERCIDRTDDGGTKILVERKSANRLQRKERT